MPPHGTGTSATDMEPKAWVAWQRQTARIDAVTGTPAAASPVHAASVKECPDCGWDGGLRRYCARHNPCFPVDVRKAAASPVADRLCGCGYRESLHKVGDEGGVYCQLAKARAALLASSAPVVAEGLDVETLARETARLIFQTWKADTSGAMDAINQAANAVINEDAERAYPVILAALRAVAEARR